MVPLDLFMLVLLFWLCKDETATASRQTNQAANGWRLCTSCSSERNPGSPGANPGDPLVSCKLPVHIIKIGTPMVGVRFYCRDHVQKGHLLGLSSSFRRHRISLKWRERSGGAEYMCRSFQGKILQIVGLSLGLHLLWCLSASRSKRAWLFHVIAVHNIWVKDDARVQRQVAQSNAVWQCGFGR